MGLVNFGVPKEESLFLRDSMKLGVFVEGGTYKGDTAKLMSGKFQKIYTIERSEKMFNIANKNLKEIENITLLKGDTREHLHTIMENNNNILFWLDAHWSGGDTYGEADECPLIEELKIIFEYDKNYVILVDDARLFLAPPPSPHKIENWPTLTDILQVLPMNYELLEFEDVIYIFSESIGKKFKVFMQKVTTDKWNQHGENDKDSFTKGLKISIRGLLKGKI